MEVHLQMLNGESTDFDDRLRCNLVEMRLTSQLTGRPRTGCKALPEFQDLNKSNHKLNLLKDSLTTCYSLMSYSLSYLSFDSV